MMNTLSEEMKEGEIMSNPRGQNTTRNYVRPISQAASTRAEAIRQRRNNNLVEQEIETASQIKERFEKELEKEEGSDQDQDNVSENSDKDL